MKLVFSSIFFVLAIAASAVQADCDAQSTPIGNCTTMSGAEDAKPLEKSQCEKDTEPILANADVKASDEALVLAAEMLANGFLITWDAAKHPGVAIYDKGGKQIPIHQAWSKMNKGENVYVLRESTGVTAEFIELGESATEENPTLTLDVTTLTPEYTTFSDACTAAGGKIVHMATMEMECPGWFTSMSEKYPVCVAPVCTEEEAQEIADEWIYSIIEGIFQKIPGMEECTTMMGTSGSTMWTGAATGLVLSASAFLLA